MKDFKYWLKVDAYTGVIQAAVVAYMAPIMALSTWQVLTKDMFAMAELLSILMGVFMLHYIGKGTNKDFLVRKGNWFIIIDRVFWGALAVLSYYHLELRYITMVVLMPVFFDSKNMMFDTIINRNMAGDELTDFRIWASKIKMMARAIGFMLAYISAKIGIDVGLGWALLSLQLIALPSLYTDLKIWSKGKDA